MTGHGLIYRSRDGQQGWDLLPFLTGHPAPGELPRPERDVLASLLRFCLEGLEHLDFLDRYAPLLPETRSVSGTPEKPEECNCKPNDCGDIRCHRCLEYVNVWCWNCKTPRGEGPCPSRRRAVSGTPEKPG